MVLLGQIGPCSEPNHSYLAHYPNTLLALVRWLQDANARDAVLTATLEPAFSTHLEKDETSEVLRGFKEAFNSFLNTEIQALSAVQCRQKPGHKKHMEHTHGMRMCLGPWVKERWKPLRFLASQNRALLRT